MLYVFTWRFDLNIKAETRSQPSFSTGIVAADRTVMNFINAIKGETNNFLLGMQTAFTIIQIYGYIDPYKSQGHKVKRKLKSVLQNNQSQ